MNHNGGGQQQQCQDPAEVKIFFCDEHTIPPPSSSSVLMIEMEETTIRGTVPDPVSEWAKKSGQGDSVQVAIEAIEINTAGPSMSNKDTEPLMMITAEDLEPAVLQSPNGNPREAILLNMSEKVRDRAVKFVQEDWRLALFTILVLFFIALLYHLMVSPMRR